MISCAWISCGILTIVQVFRLKIMGTGYYLGTGLISVMGTSFTFLPIARNMVLDEIGDAQADWPVCQLDNASQPIYTGDCCGQVGFNLDCRGAGAIGYGKFLGTVLVASLFEVGIAFIPPKYLKRMFPSVVTGSAVMLIGGGLIASGIKYVGGGVFCAENSESRAAAGVGALGFSSAGGNRFLRNEYATGKFAPPGPMGTIGPQLCYTDNGDVVMSFGSAPYVGLAFSVMVFATFLQIFGSPFFKSTFLIWALGFGCAVAGAGHDVDGDGTPEGFFRKQFLEGNQEADDITFLWANRTFPLGFDVHYFPVIIIGFLISTAESIGDIDMSARYSKITDEDDISSRVQGGLLADGVNSFFAALFGSPPNTTFSQNNGLIALTCCASRSVGFSCAFWLILFGVFGKFGGAFAAIPLCVIGGLVLISWASVFVSGMQMATEDFTRRNQYILTISLGVGLGVAMEGHIFGYPGPLSFYRKVLEFDHGFWPMKMVCKTSMASLAGGGSDDACPNYNGPCCSEWDESAKGGRTTIITILKTPYGIGFIIAFVLNAIMPYDKVLDDDEFKPGSATVSSSSSSSSSATA